MDPTGTYHGDSDLQLERINVYYNEATGNYRFYSLICTITISVDCTFFKLTQTFLNSLATATVSLWLFVARYLCSIVVYFRDRGAGWLAFSPINHFSVVAVS